MIHGLSTYRDGGTIKLEGRFVMHDEETGEEIINHAGYLCLDHRIKSENEGTLWTGHPSEDKSKKIENPKIIAKVLEDLNRFKRTQDAVIGQATQDLSTLEHFSDAED